MVSLRSEELKSFASSNAAILLSIEASVVPGSTFSATTVVVVVVLLAVSSDLFSTKK